MKPETFSEHGTWLPDREAVPPHQHPLLRNRRPWQAAVPVSAPAGKPEPPELFPQNREPASAITLPEGTMEDKLQYLRNLAQNWKPARELNSLRDTMVFATGNPHTKLMLIGEAPGYYEEVQQEPFVGRSRGKTQPDIKGYGALQRHGLHFQHRQIPPGPAQPANQ